MEHETLVGLVSRYSPSGQEEPAVDWLTGRMQALGYSRTFKDGAGNAVGVMGDGPRQVVLLGHIDTVPGEIPVKINEGILFGRGAVDAKGPLACFVDAVAQLGSVDGWQFVVIGAVDEERNSCGARFAATKYRPEYAIIGEPNHWNRFALGYKGVAWSEITVKRSQTHSAGIMRTASEAAVNTWLAIQDFADKFNQDKPRVFEQILLTLRGLQSGEDGFWQWATLELDTRLPPGISPAQWYTWLDEICGDADVERKGFAVPATVCEKNTPLVRAFLSSIRAQGGKPAFVYKTGTADLNTVMPTWQCPALVYGPGDSTLDHTLDEQVPLEEYELAVTVLTNALKELIQKG
ncbi:MAG: [amino group carrier protein]-lysine/ornithine hydrolase [Chloroflexota bacterium]|nr:[amino group carrier protein]-lysine/ornithine hydrolase [Chloroflexota bacterium]